MNEGEESIPSTVTRKKRRGSGFRFSSKKNLERSKLKRIARASGSELASVKKALSYPSTLSSGSAAGSGGPHCLDRVEEHDGERIEDCLNDSFSDRAFAERVSQTSFFFFLYVIRI
jgi:DNA-binding transcriptional MerR regulator